MAFDTKEMVKSKQALRRKLAERPISEKLRITEDLSERSLALRPDTSASPPDAPWPIPPHWQWKKMGEVATVVGGSTPPTDHQEYFGGDIPWITPADLSKYTEKTISRGARNISEVGLKNSGARLLPAGTVLFSSRAPIGYVAIAANPVSTNQGFKSFILNDDVRSDFAYYYLHRARELARSLASGTTFLEISRKKAAQIPIPVPPLDEQQRIVAEIEKQFTRLDAGVASLKRVQTALKRYRASVLKAACDGRLVPNEAEIAGKENRSYETGEELLQRILKKRREMWNGKGKYQEPAAPDGGQLSSLPKAWTWATADQLSDASRAITYGVIKLGVQVDDGVPVLRSSDVRHLRLDLEGVKRISPSIASGFKRTFLRGSEVLVTVRGTLGGVVAVPANCEGFNISREVAMIAPVESQLAKFLAAMIGSPPIQIWLLRRTKGIAYTGINIETLKQLPIPLAPLAEQCRIVAEVDRRFSVVEKLDALISTELQRAGRLRQAILQHAFSGEFSTSAKAAA